MNPPSYTVLLRGFNPLSSFFKLTVGGTLEARGQVFAATFEKFSPLPKDPAFPFLRQTQIPCLSIVRRATISGGVAAHSQASLEWPWPRR